MCHHQATQLVEIAPELDQLGVRLVAVGTGSAVFAANFRQAVAWPGDVFLDPDARLFAALKLQRLSKLQALGRFFTPSTISWARAHPSNKSDMKGDGLQTGGVFALLPTGSGLFRLAYAFVEGDHEATKFADLQALLAALQPLPSA